MSNTTEPIIVKGSIYIQTENLYYYNPINMPHNTYTHTKSNDIRTHDYSCPCGYLYTTRNCNGKKTIQMIVRLHKKKCELAKRPITHEDTQSYMENGNITTTQASEH